MFGSSSVNATVFVGLEDGRMLSDAALYFVSEAVAELVEECTESRLVVELFSLFGKEESFVIRLLSWSDHVSSLQASSTFRASSSHSSIALSVNINCSRWFRLSNPSIILLVASSLL